MRVEWRLTGDVRPYPGNPRQNEEAVPLVANSLREFGWRQPIVVDADGTVVAGHTRLKAAQSLGMDKVPVVVASDLTPAQVAAYRLADNKVAEAATWDAGLLAQELDGLSQDFDMGEFGFSEEDGFTEPELSEVEEVEPDEDAPERVAVGELWRLGDHVLLCADSTDPESIARALGSIGGGCLADLLLTDPPYNIAYEGAAGTIDNDDWSDDQGFCEFLIDAFTASMAGMRAGAAFYVWYASSQAHNFLRAARAAGMDVRQTLAWVKSSFTLGRQDYQWRHEPCLYGWKEGAAHYFCDSRRESTVIEDEHPDISKMSKVELAEALREAWAQPVPTTALEFDKPSRSEEHPTMKPVKLFAYLVGNSTRSGEVVLDPFGGSGTSVVACEQLGRRCATIELDPHYASVIVERWERLTGREAQRVS